MTPKPHIDATVSQTCLGEVKLPSGFFALTSDYESTLGNWYAQLFNLEVAKEFQLPDGQTRGVLMRRGDFVVEIFYQKGAVDRSLIQSSSQVAHWKGFQKVGIFVDSNVHQLKECLLEEGVSAGRIFRDDSLNIDLLLVRDPEENIIEIIQRHK
jgi:hypothetical protein